MAVSSANVYFSNNLIHFIEFINVANNWMMLIMISNRDVTISNENNIIDLIKIIMKLMLITNQWHNGTIAND